MTTFVFTYDNVTVEIKARNFFTACQMAGSEIIRRRQQTR
jgi:hypothetical protein